jgi:dienelactone hydrolase
MQRLAARLALAAALALSAAAGSAAEAPAAPAPTGLARFTLHDRFVEASLSPKGRYLAAIALRGGRRSLVVVELATRKVTGTIDPSEGSVAGDFYWANEERLVVELVDQDGTMAGPVSRGEIYAMNANGSGGRRLFGHRVKDMQTGTHIKTAEPDRAWGRVVATLPRDDRYVLISSKSWDEQGDRQEQLWKLDVHSGVKSRVGQAPAPEARFYTDEEGELRLAAALQEDATYRYFLRDRAADSGWREITKLAGFTAASRPVAFVAKRRTVELWEPLGAGFGFYAVSVETGERKLLGKTEVAPPRAFLRERDGGEALAFESQPDLPTWEVLDGAHPLAKALDGLLSASEGMNARIVSVTEDARLALAYVYGDRQPGRWLLLDVAKHSAEPVLEARPWIDPSQMAEMQAFHINVSDGLRIHGYVTYPRGLAPGAKAPLIVLPHGGPFGLRDHWEFDPVVQLLASQGFAVLQVNFRGSGGYGAAFVEAGWRHWGDRMIEDLLDATRWVVKKGKVDGGRMCTYGVSYGGYAALQAVSLAPDLFRCAVGNAGVYDLTRVEENDEWVTSGRTRGYFRTTLGEDQAALKATSPVFHADKIKVPVLLIHGGRDQRVPIVHAEKLRDALTALGRPPAWLEEPLEGHGFYDEGARLRMSEALVAFLKQHTAPAPGAAATAAPAPAAP